MRIYEKVFEKFPDASFLQAHNAYSYCGFPALDSSGSVVAVTCLLDSKPHDFSDEDKDLLNIFGRRIGFEIEREKHLVERKQAEEKLQQSELMTRSLLDGSPVCHKIIDLDSNLQFMSAAGIKRLKISDIKSFYGQPYPPKFFPELARILLTRNLKKALVGKVSTVEVLAHDIEGNEAWFHTTFVPVLDDDHRVKYVICSSVDITERKWADKEVYKLSHAIEQSPVAIFITDNSGQIEYANPLFYQLTGYRTEEVIGNTPRILKSGEHPDNFYKKLWETISSGNIWTGELHNKKKNGDLYWEFASISPVLDSNGEITNYIAVKQDITARKKAEELLEQSERRLRVLSSHVLTVQEMERKRLSTELHDGLGQELSLLKLQLSGMNRELMVDQTELKKKFDESLHYIDQVIENARRLSHELRPAILEDIGLSSALKRLIDDFTKHYDAVVSVDADSINDLFTEGREIIIYRLLQEILTNIVKHSRATEVSIVIKDRGEDVFFRIEDDGVGFNAAKSRKVNSGEMGIGLITINERFRIVDASYDIRSQEGKGVKIIFSIPTDKERKKFGII
ncbi:MAG: PAS domain S-box protein [Deltaproteobacteria bacterium]|nr:PAS domain S-box protein [Deltaproteobacteria bacterium]